jgi:hypothetical protein
LHRVPTKLSGTVGLGRVQEGVAIVHELVPAVTWNVSRRPMLFQPSYSVHPFARYEPLR